MLELLSLLALKQIKGYEYKKCFYCDSPITKKYGIRNGKQKCKCHACGKQFLGGNRASPEELWIEYREGKQTYSQLAIKHKCSKRTMQIKIDLHQVTLPQKTAREVVILMEATYWWRAFGVMLFKDNITKENLLKHYIKNETNCLYKSKMAFHLVWPHGA